MIKKRSRPAWILVAVALTGITAVALIRGHEPAIVFIEDTSNRDEIGSDSVRYENLSLRNSNEYNTWKNTADTSFVSLFNGNQAADILERRPNMVILWAGNAFSKDYRTPRGHIHSIHDVRSTLRTGAPSEVNAGPQSAACWSCKSPDVSRLIETAGEDAFYRRSWYSLGSEVVNPVGCADCHDPENMTLRVTRSFFTEAYQHLGNSIDDASEQEMRTLVCAQCHAEYYFEGERKAITLPWDQGYSMEEIEAYYDRIGFSDFTHKLSRAPLLKAQHPDFELAQMGIHAQRGVSCGECHMPYEGKGEKGFNNHHVRSPLAMIDRTCQTCHRESVETLRNNVYERQEKVLGLRDRLEDELAKAHIEAKFAWDRGASKAQMDVVLRLIRQAQWRWDFAIASHGASFHAPLEVARILGCGLDKAQQARMAIMKVLARQGYTADVPIPDISTKAKAQRYIGLDMLSEEAAKREFLETVIPEWTRQARENNRFIEEPDR